ncbi:MAG: ribosome maturation factor RimM [Gammaproteobacteria bacterium]|nr:ribosome maturation factor RimM [Gammaproteobacteria bacterium]
MSKDPDRVVKLGYVAGVYGVKGWLKIHSFTEPRENLAGYRDLLFEQAGRQDPFVVESSKSTSKNLLIKLAGIDDRDAAAALIGAEIAVPRSALPDCAPGEYYWADLEGLTVRSQQGHVLGTVERLLATGANDVLVLSGGPNRLIPFVLDRIVLDIDLARGQIVVDWEESFWD